MQTTVICHFYNEEKLLPQWLKLHREIFDCGILIDYHSTDNSVNIIREMVPDWYLTTSVNKEFIATDCDKEVVELEVGLSGWKMALNVTEFLLCPNLKGYLEEYERQKPDILAIQCEAILPFDRPEEIDQEIDFNRPLWEQRTWGIVGSIAKKSGFDCAKHRVIHRASHGRYSIGRHVSFLPNQFFSPNMILFCLTHGLVKCKEQRNQINSFRIPQCDVQKGRGLEHRWDLDQILERYHQEKRYCMELKSHVPYQQILCQLQ